MHETMIKEQCNVWLAEGSHIKDCIVIRISSDTDYTAGCNFYGETIWKNSTFYSTVPTLYQFLKLWWKFRYVRKYQTEVIAGLRICT